MSKPKAPRIGTCIYCGKEKPITADHVPPKNLFDRPFPPNLLTVPACADCNGGFKKDDEYFRIALTITDKSKGQRGREGILPTVMRGINSSKADRFRTTLLSNTRVVPRFSPSGIFLGNQRQISLDGARIEGIARRIVQGLFFHVKGHRLPDDHAINVVPVGRFREVANLHPEMDLALREFIALIAAEPITEHRDVFGYRWIQSPNGPSHTMWLLYFYEKLEFFCTTFSMTSIEELTLEGEIERVQTLAKGRGA
ncbi:hypothetical protein [Burkholderia cepacia]|uniref:hypothetical protein n=1 Tax=Burkholderia cepacia TaxID=292 RepID=UPI00398F3C12